LQGSIATGSSVGLYYATWVLRLPDARLSESREFSGFRGKKKDSPLVA